VKIEDQLIELSGRHQQLPPIEQRLNTILGFARKEGDEETWNRILRYLLSPDAGHGLGDSVLRQFIRALTSGDPSRQDNSLLNEMPTWRASEIQVDDQVKIGDDRITDLVIRDPGRWFICIELKVWSSEEPNQTIDYAKARELGDEYVSSYPEQGQHYLYITRSGDSSKSEDFIDYSWQHIARHLRHTLADESTHSARGLAQVREFTDAISNQFNFHMTSNNTHHPIDDRIKLYNEYRDDLLSLEEAFEEFAEREGNRWDERFPTSFAPDKWNEDWFTYQRRTNQGHIYHRSWTFHPNGPKGLNSAPLVHLEFDIKPEQLRHGQMPFRFSVSGGDENPKEKCDWREKVQELLKEDTAFEDALPRNASWGSKKSHLTEYTYSEIAFDEETLYETIQQGFNDHYEAAMILTDLVEKKVDPSLEEIK